ncbi:MAG TPA: winged helix-turn-helix domain-containing protein [Ktedonobacterales bacterium]
MDTRVESRASAPRAVDLRRGRAPEIEIVDCATYDFLISLHVTLSSPESGYADFDIGRDWIERARASCEARAPQALDVLGRYVGDARPSSLRATLISLVGQAPAPSTATSFLNWLTSAPANDLAETLLDQDGLGSEWPAMLTAAFEERAAAPEGEPGRAAQRLIDLYPREARPTALRVLLDIESVRAELVAALWGWYDAVFASEETRLTPLLKREADAMTARRQDTPQDAFIEREMRGVQWQRPAGLRRIIFAPSYFCKPAVFYHFWRGALTFCSPVESAGPGASGVHMDPIAPAGDTLRFFEALGDDTRLRILRLLADREMYLTELAERLRLTKATTKHHMVRLRAAGIVTLYDRERLTYYALRPDIARRASQFLDQLTGGFGSGAM